MERRRYTKDLIGQKLHGVFFKSLAGSIIFGRTCEAFKRHDLMLTKLFKKTIQLNTMGSEHLANFGSLLLDFGPSKLDPVN